jgi:hypothetical protein
VKQFWKDTHMKEACDVSLAYNVSLLLNRSQEELRTYKFFAATDHNAQGAIDASLTAMGAIMFDPARLPMEGLEHVLRLEEPWNNHGLKMQFLLLDLAALVLVDEFVGVPVSSLTRSVCYWRAARGRPGRDDMCGVLALQNISPRCSEAVCDPKIADCCGGETTDT